MKLYIDEIHEDNTLTGEQLCIDTKNASWSLFETKPGVLSSIKRAFNRLFKKG